MTCFPLRASSTCRRTGVRQPRRGTTNTPQHNTRNGTHACATVSVTAQRMRSYRAPLPIERPASLPPDLAAVKQAIELVRQRKPREATALATSISDQLMQKLVEWALLRQPESEVGFERYAAFISTNPDWPSIPLFRRRAEVRLSQERRDAAYARSLLGGEPTSSVDRASGKLEVRAAQDTDKRWRRTSPASPQAYRSRRCKDRL